MRGLPLVSVVICTYNREDRVTRAIRSVQSQTYSNIEILVVDDASPDRTTDVVEAIGDSRITYLRHQVNRGQAAGRNTGILAASGEYIAFLDDDDEWLPTKVEKQVELCQKNGLDGVLSASLMSDGRIKRFGKTEVKTGDLRRGNDFAAGSGLLVRASVLRELWFDEAIEVGEDWDMLIRLVKKGYRLGYIDEPLCRISDGDHMRSTNKARNQTVEELEKRMRIIHKHVDFFGPYWARYHVAGTLLSYFWYRKGKFQQVIYAIRRCGMTPVAVVFVEKMVRQIRKQLEHA